MAIGRRGFLKRLGVGLASLTMAGRLKAIEDAKAQKYPQTFEDNQVPPKINRNKNLHPYSGIYALSGSYIPSGNVQFVSGRLDIPRPRYIISG